jgi:hypothetical protein
MSVVRLSVVAPTNPLTIKIQLGVPYHGSHWYFANYLNALNAQQG